MITSIVKMDGPPLRDIDIARIILVVIEGFGEGDAQFIYLCETCVKPTAYVLGFFGVPGLD